MSEDVTRLLNSDTSDEARERLFATVYSELGRIARHALNSNRHGATLETSVLIHEAYLKLFANERPDYASRRHFYATAARAMRQILIDHARSKLTARRGEGAGSVSLDDLDATDEASTALHNQAEEFVQLDTLMQQLGEFDARLERLVELRYIAGLTLEEVAEVSELSLATVKRELRAARAFLASALDPQSTAASLLGVVE